MGKRPGSVSAAGWSLPSGVTRAYLEVGEKRAFACAVDWPGWCRAGRTEEAAIDAFLDAQRRYAAVVPEIGHRDVELDIVGTLPGTAGTEFGVPEGIGPWDLVEASTGERERLAGIVERCWAAFDQVVAGAPTELRKGPRGGGRDRDRIVDHVNEAERAYASKLRARLPPRTPVTDQRGAIAAALRHPPADIRWPVQYAARRYAWHLLDHAWEIEDRTPA